MARIPSYDSPQVQAQPLPGVRISDAPAREMAAAGAAAARGLNAVSGAFSEIAAAERDKANRAAQLEIENSLSALETEIVHAPETGLLNKRGKDAIGAHEQFAESWDRRQSAIISKAPRHLQEWAQQQATQRRQGAQRILMRHSVQEGQQYAKDQANALLTNAEHSAVLNFQDPARVDEEAARAMLAADQAVDLEGGSGLERGNMRAAAASRVYRAVLDRKIANDPSDAAAYLETVRDRLTGDDLTRLESTLRPVLTDADAGALLQAVINGGPGHAGAAPAADAAGSLQQAEEIARASVGRTVGLESGGRADAKNPRSTAAGVGQFLERTWLEVLGRNRPELLAGKSRAQVLALRNDPTIAREMTEAFAVENARGLYESGLPVTPQTIYLAHHFGIGGARQMLRADPDTPVSNLLPGRALAANPYLQGKTVADVIANHSKRAGDTEQAATSRVTTRGARNADGSVSWAEVERQGQMIPNPLLRDRFLARANAMQSLEKQARAEADKARDERVIQAINANPNASLARALSPEDYAAVAKTGDLPRLDNYREAMAKGGLTQDDYALVDEIERQAALDPQGFMRRNIAADAGRLSTATLTRLLDKQRQGSKPAAQADWATEAQRTDQLFRLAGVGTDQDARGQGSEAKNAGRARHRGELRIAYQMAMEEYVRVNGKKPLPEAHDKLIESVALRYSMSRFLDGSSMKTRNDERMKEKKPLIYEAAERAGLDPAVKSRMEHESAKQTLARRLGYTPTDAFVDAFLRNAGAIK